jgi:hypothetical protein
LYLVVHCKQDPLYVFPEKKPRRLIPNFFIHVSVSDTYIPTIGLPILLQFGAVSFLGIFVSNLQYSVFAV